MTAVEQEQTRDEQSVRPLLLASASPRRHEILARLGLPFRAAPADIDEDAFARGFQGSLSELVQALAVEKARAAAASQPTFAGWILAADTLVTVDGEVLTKPTDSDDATRMLRLLRGRAHHVATGVALADTQTGEMVSGSLDTTVWMRAYSDAEIARYVASGDPLDKSGSYAVQHRLFHPVERVEGCCLSVVGLPLCLGTRLLRQQGLPAALLTAAAAQHPQGCVWSSLCMPPLPPGAALH